MSSWTVSRLTSAPWMKVPTALATACGSAALHSSWQAAVTATAIESSLPSFNG